MLFTLVTGPHFEKAQHTLQQALKKGVDGIEIRIDTFSSIDLSEIKRLRNNASTIYVLMTLRPVSQGGFFSGSQEERLEWIEKLASLQPDLFDLEYDIPQTFRQKLAEKYPHIKWMSSYHNFEETPKDLPLLFQSLQSPYTHVYKIATMASSSLDTLRMMSFTYNQSPHHHVIGIAMGEYGLATRVLGPAIGNYLSYVFIDPQEQTAPGQLPIDELLHVYRYRSINNRTALFGLIGSPVDKSLGALIHNAVFDALKINAVYIKMDVQTTELNAFLSLIRKLPFQGFSVTMPLKEAVVPLLDEIAPDAKAIGAINTIEIKQGRLIGHNTDGVGAMNAIAAKTSVEGKKMVVIGAGGAAKALIHEAIKRRVHVFILNRTAWKAHELALQLHCTGGGLDRLPEIYAQGYDIIVNCTPDREPIHPELILPGCFAMDMVYTPQETHFLKEALKRNCQPIYGYEMFINQAVEQQLIWSCQKQDRAKIKAIIEKTMLLRSC